MDGAVASMARLGTIDPSLDVPKPPVNVAATGPRMITLAARLADGVSFALGADLERLRQCRDLVLEACRADGRDPDDADARLLRPGRRLRRARRTRAPRRDPRARDDPLALLGLRGQARSRRSPATTSARSSVAARDGGRAALERAAALPAPPGGAPGELDFYPREAVDDEFIDRFGIVGSAEHCAERLQQILDVGITRIYIGTRGVGIDLEERNTRRIGREVLPLLQPGPGRELTGPRRSDPRRRSGRGSRRGRARRTARPPRAARRDGSTEIVL